MGARIGRTAAGLLLIGLANVIGGATYPAQKLALQGLPPATITLVRNLFALVPLTLLCARAGGSLRTFTPRERWRVLFLGVVAYALPMHLGVVGTKLASSANASILILVEPPTIVLVAWLVLRERVRAATVLGVALGLAGAVVVVLAGAGPGALVGGHVLGNALLALHGFLWGLQTPFAKPLTARHDPFVLTTWVVVASLLLLAPLSALELATTERADALLPALLWSAALGLVGTFLGLALWFAALRFLPAAAVAPFLFVQTAVGVGVGVLVFGEPFSGRTALGTAILVGGVALALWGEVRGARRSAPAAGS